MQHIYGTSQALAILARDNLLHFYTISLSIYIAFNTTHWSSIKAIQTSPHIRGDTISLTHIGYIVHYTVQGICKRTNGLINFESSPNNLNIFDSKPFHRKNSNKEIQN